MYTGKKMNEVLVVSLEIPVHPKALPRRPHTKPSILIPHAES